MQKAPQQIQERRRYDQQFKDDAVNRVIRTGKSCTEVGKELGINGNILARWRREYLAQSDAVGTRSGELKPSEMAEELRKARHEIEDLREQRDILKKALGIFSRQPHSAERL